jgi:hypothetical protein
MSLKYRKLSPTKDYTFGNGSLDFITDIDAVAQAVYTRLYLWRESYWRDLNAGIPMTQRILGQIGSSANLTAIDGLIQAEISGTKDVISIVSFESAFDSESREYTYTCTINTAYSEAVIEGTL